MDEKTPEEAEALAETAEAMASQDPSTFRPLSEFMDEIRAEIARNTHS